MTTRPCMSIHKRLINSSQFKLIKKTFSFDPPPSKQPDHQACFRIVNALVIDELMIDEPHISRVHNSYP